MQSPAISSNKGPFEATSVFTNRSIWAIARWSSATLIEESILSMTSRLYAFSGYSKTRSHLAPQLALRPIHYWRLFPGPFVLRKVSLNSPSPAVDRDRTVSRSGFRRNHFLFFSKRRGLYFHPLRRRDRKSAREGLTYYI